MVYEFPFVIEDHVVWDVVSFLNSSFKVCEPCDGDVLHFLVPAILLEHSGCSLLVFSLAIGCDHVKRLTLQLLSQTDHAWRYVFASDSSPPDHEENYFAF